MKTRVGSLIALWFGALLLAIPSPAQEAVPFIPDPCPDGEAVLAAQTPADRELQKRAEAALRASPLDHLSEIDVVVIGSTACLRGRAANTSDYEQAEETVAQVKGVAEVSNRLRIPLAE